MKVIRFGVIGSLIGGLVATVIAWLFFLSVGFDYWYGLVWVGVLPGALIGLVIGVWKVLSVSPQRG